MSVKSRKVCGCTAKPERHNIEMVQASSNGKCSLLFVLRSSVENHLEPGSVHKVPFIFLVFIKNLVVLSFLMTNTFRYDSDDNRCSINTSSELGCPRLLIEKLLVSLSYIQHLSHSVDYLSFSLEGSLHSTITFYMSQLVHIYTTESHCFYSAKYLSWGCITVCRARMVTAGIFGLVTINAASISKAFCSASKMVLNFVMCNKF